MGGGLGSLAMMVGLANKNLDQPGSLMSSVSSLVLCFFPSGLD